MKIEITGVAETMLITVYARAVETLKKEPRIEDVYAVEMVKKLDYDFKQYKNAKMSLSGVVLRTMLFDEITKDFISRNPDAVIVNLGAGLDARFFRVDNGKIFWYDTDLPEQAEVLGQGEGAAHAAQRSGLEDGDVDGTEIGRAHV